MNKELFNSLSFEKQLEYINDQLSLGKSVSKVSEELGYSKRAIGKKFNHKGYFLNEKKDKYILKEAIEGDNVGDSSNSYISMLVENNKVTSSLKNYEDGNGGDSEECCVEDLKEDTKKDFNYNLGDNEKDCKEGLTLLLQEKAETLKEMIEWFEAQKKNKLIIKNSLVVDIDLPKDIVKKSIRISDKVWNDFNDFCEKHEDFTKQDILNLALTKFLQNNK